MERTRQIIAWELLFILVFASLLIIDGAENISSITGRAISGVTQDSVLAEIEATLPDIDFIGDIKDANLCIIVNVDSSTRYSYEVVKIGEAIAVTSSSNWMCNGIDREDIIVSYVSYEKFRQHVNNPPDFAQLRSTSNGANFYIYPSKYIASGLLINNAGEFDERFGDVLRKYMNAADVQKLLNPDLAVVQKPEGILSYIFYVILGLVVVVILIGVFIFTHQKKPEVEQDLELTAYIKSAISQGYTQEQVIELLVSNGWDKQKVEQALNSINSEVTGTTASP